MSISNPNVLCERVSVSTALQLGRMVLNYHSQTSLTGRTMKLHAAWLAVALLAAAVYGAPAQLTNPAAGTNQAAGTNAPAPVAAAQSEPAPAAPPVVASPSRSGASAQKVDESAYTMIAERNIFNANRVGAVRLNTRGRPRLVETFTLVGTMAYEKGVFAFFEGSTSELSKVLKTNSVIAGYKLAEIYSDSVKLEADGKQIELPIGSQMRREDAGTWKMAEAPASSGASETASAVARVGGSVAPASTTSVPANQSEILKRLMERREKE